ncbi:hypothetical protein [Methanimicrococcus hongohii]|nr:hypothetical protein [Methanimicrococcus sp. Hf6]
MKKLFVFIFMTLFLFLAVGAGGCIEDENETYADVNSVSVLADDENVIIYLNVTVHNGQTINEKKAEINVSDDLVQVYLPASEVKTDNSVSSYYETIVLTLSKNKVIPEILYRVSVNGETDEERISFFTYGNNYESFSAGRPDKSSRGIDLQSIFVRKYDGQILLDLNFKNAYNIDSVTKTVSDDVVYIGLPFDELSRPMNRQYTIDITNLTQYETGTFYTVLINEDEEIKSGFVFEENDTLKIYPAGVESIIISSDGTNVLVSSWVSTGTRSAFSIDDEMIEESEKFDENQTYKIYIPAVQKNYEAITLEMALYEKQFSIGKLNEMEDGVYKVRVNGYEASFTVLDHEVWYIRNYGSYY